MGNQASSSSRAASAAHGKQSAEFLRFLQRHDLQQYYEYFVEAGYDDLFTLERLHQDGDFASVLSAVEAALPEPQRTQLSWNGHKRKIDARICELAHRRKGVGNSAALTSVPQVTAASPLTHQPTERNLTRANSVRFSAVEQPSDPDDKASPKLGPPAIQSPRQHRNTSSSDKPVAVISYQSKQTEHLEHVKQLLDAWGFRSWDGRDVIGGDNWTGQWIQKVSEPTTKLIVFILSMSFFDSRACYREFFHVMNGPLAERAFVIMHDLNTMSAVGNAKPGTKISEIQFILNVDNYIHPLEVLINQLGESRGKGMWELKIQEAAMLLMEKNQSPWPQVGKGSIADLNVRLTKQWGEKSEQFAKTPPQGVDEVQFVCISGSTNFDFSFDSSGNKDNGKRTLALLDELGKQLADLEYERVDKDSGQTKRGKIMLVTGGFSGVGEHAARAMEQARTDSVINILPDVKDDLDKTLWPFTIGGKQAPLAWRDKVLFHPGRDDADRVRLIKEAKKGDAKALEALGLPADWSAKARFGAWDSACGATIFIGKTNAERQRLLGMCMPVLIAVEGGPGVANEASIAQSAKRFVVPIGCLSSGAPSPSAAQKIGQAAFKMVPIDKKDPAYEKDPEKKVPKPCLGWLKNDEEIFSSYLALQQGDGNDPVEVARLVCAIVRKLLSHQVSFDGLIHSKWPKMDSKLELLQEAGGLRTLPEGNGDTAAGVQQAWSQPGMPKGLTLVRNVSQLCEFLDEYLGGAYCVLVDGHGSKNQYFDFQGPPEDMKTALLGVVKHIDAKCGMNVQRGWKEYDTNRKWVAVYGGDDYRDDKHDAAKLVKALHDIFGVRIVATQTHVYADYILNAMVDDISPERNCELIGAYEHLHGGVAFIYPTSYKTDLAGIPEPIFGGLNSSGVPVGASSIWFDKELRPYVKYFLAVGSGPIGKDNFSYALGVAQEAQPPEFDKDLHAGSAKLAQLEADVKSLCHAKRDDYNEATWEALKSELDDLIEHDDQPALRWRAMLSYYSQLIRVPALYVPARALNCGPGEEPGSWLGQLHDFIKTPKVMALMTRDSKERRMEPFPWFEFQPIEFETTDVATINTPKGPLDLNLRHKVGKVGRASPTPIARWVSGDL